MTNTDFKIALTPGSSYADAFRYSLDPLWQVRSRGKYLFLDSFARDVGASFELVIKAKLKTKAFGDPLFSL